MIHCQNAKRHLHEAIHCSNICNSKYWKQLKCPSVGDWLSKPWYCHVEFYAAMTSNEDYLYVPQYSDLQVRSSVKKTTTKKQSRALYV